MSERDRLAVALAQLDDGDWRRFEEFASAFLADEYPELHVLAGVGDKGRDAVLGTDDGVVVQYSVTRNWRAKILQTQSRLGEAALSPLVLVYVTNQRIGPQADVLTKELREGRLVLDIRDDTWFLARVDRSDATRNASHALTSRYVDSLLPQVSERLHRALDHAEARAGLLYIELQITDAEANRNLTKLAYESIVLGALGSTTPEERLNTQDIVRAVRRILPGHQADRIESLTRAALTRLRQAERVTYQRATDSYALHYAERTALIDRLAFHERERLELRADLAEKLNRAASALEMPWESADNESALDAIEEAIEGVLDRNGNEFVNALESGSARVALADVYEITRDVVYRRAKTLHVPSTAQLDDVVELAHDVVTEILASPSGTVQSHLRDLADSYTLLAFLQETPDVQRAVSHLFSRGHLVLDATEILPLFVEYQLPRERQRQTTLLAAARSAGMRLTRTKGVLNEVDTHLDRAILASEIAHRWEGDLPFVYQQWLLERPLGASFRDFVGLSGARRSLNGI